MAQLQPQGLLAKKSLYDKNKHNILGDAIGIPPNGNNSPSEGNYYANDTLQNDSPFINGSGDHMIDLLTTTVQSGLSGITYLPSPIGANATTPSSAHFQDLDPTLLGQHSGQQSNPTLGQFGGPYLSMGPCTTGGGFCS